MSPSSSVKFSIETKSVIKILLLLVAAGFLWVIRDIVALVFVCLILASALYPTVDHLQQYRLPRPVAVILIYLTFISVFSSVIIAVSGPIASEIGNIAQEFPSYYAEISNNIAGFQGTTSFFTTEQVTNLRGNLDQVLINLTQMASKNAISIVSTVFGGIVTFLLILVITYYFIMHDGAVKLFIIGLVPKEKEEKTIQLMDKIQKKLGLWLRGQLLLSLIIFVITYIGLSIVGIRYALVLALLAGLLEVIPYMGPILAAIPAIFLTLISPWGGLFKACVVVVLYVLVQQIENNLVVPKVMARTVGLNPLITIIAFLIGARVSGMVGALMAVPVATAITVYLQEERHSKELIE